MYFELQQLTSLLAAQAQGGGCGGDQGTFLLPVVFVAIIYFVMIQPTAREQKRKEELLSKLKRGDKILTRSGIIGTITDISDDLVTLELARNVRVEMLKTTIEGKYPPPSKAKKSESTSDTTSPSKKKG